VTFSNGSRVRCTGRAERTKRDIEWGPVNLSEKERGLTIGASGEEKRGSEKKKKHREI